MVTTAPVTMRALVQRIARRLAPDGIVFVRAMGKKEIERFGRYYTRSLARHSDLGVIIRKRNIEPEAFAREIGALESWESLDVSSRRGVIAGNRPR